MFFLNKFTVRIYLKSGQTVKVQVTDYKVTEEADKIIRYNFEGLDTRYTIPVSEMAGMTFHKPLWKRFLVWVLN